MAGKRTELIYRRDWSRCRAAAIWCPAACTAEKLCGRLGLAAARHHALVVIGWESDDLMNRLVAASAALSSPERSACRLLLLESAAELDAPGDVKDLAARALGAESLSVELARYREPWLAEMLDEAQFTLHYQPIANLASGQAVGYECLLRGLGDDGQTIGPLTILAAAERANLVRALDQMVRLRAVESLLHAALPSSCKLFVNIQAETILDPAYCLGPIFRWLDQNRRSPEQLVLEIQGAQDALNHEDLAVLMDHIHGQGAAVCIDDLGGGDEGIYWLTHLRPDYIKLDLPLLERTARLAPHGAKMVPARSAPAGGKVSPTRFAPAGAKVPPGDAGPGRQRLIQFLDEARRLGVKVIAERVERPDQLDLCREVGINIVQGYLLSRPLADLSAISRHRSWLRQLNQPDPSQWTPTG